MRLTLALPCAAFAIAASTPSAHAHGIAGARVFVTTLLVDDPSVADEASLPTVLYTPQGGGNSPLNSTWTVTGEIDKRLTENFGVGVNYGYTVIPTKGSKTQSGFTDLIVTPKLKVYVNAEHEFLASIGVINEISGTGATRTGADKYGYSQPTVYFGKGLGDLPIGPLRAFAVTGEFGYAISHRGLKTTSTVDPDSGATVQTSNNGNANRWAGGATLQYSFAYLRSQVRDYHLPEFVDHIVPLVELAWSSPAQRPSALGTQYLIGAGAVYGADWYQVGLEALIPGNKQTARGTGVIAQFHVYFDDLFPNSLGKPIFQW